MIALIGIFLALPMVWLLSVYVVSPLFSFPASTLRVEISQGTFLWAGGVGMGVSWVVGAIRAMKVHRNILPTHLHPIPLPVQEPTVIRSIPMSSTLSGIFRSLLRSLTEPWSMVCMLTFAVSILVLLIVPASIQQNHSSLFSWTTLILIIIFTTSLITILQSVLPLLHTLLHSFLFSWWQQTGVQILVLGNIRARSEENKKAVIVGAIATAIGCVVAQSVSGQLSRQSNRAVHYGSYGSELAIRRIGNSRLELQKVSNLAETMKSRGVEWQWSGVSFPIETYLTGGLLKKKQPKVSVSNLGGQTHYPALIHVVGPSLSSFQVPLPSLHSPDQSFPSSLSPYSLLYTRWGNAHSIIGKEIRENMGIECGNTDQNNIYRLTIQSSPESHKRLALSCLSSLSIMAGTNIADPPGANATQTILINAESFYSLHENTELPMSQVIYYMRVYIKPSSVTLPPNPTEEEVVAYENKLLSFYNRIKSILPGTPIDSVPTRLFLYESGLTLALRVVYLVNILAHFLSIFTLANTLTNTVTNSARDIATLTAMGIGRITLCKVYLSECILIILSAQILGSVGGYIGTRVMAAENSLLLGYWVEGTDIGWILIVAIGVNTVVTLPIVGIPLLRYKSPQYVLRH